MHVILNIHTCSITSLIQEIVYEKLNLKRETIGVVGTGYRNDEIIYFMICNYVLAFTNL